VARRRSPGPSRQPCNADLVVLNSDYFAVSDESIKQLGSILTIVGGRIVHDAGVLRVK
jgi:hypothetical protein